MSDVVIECIESSDNYGKFVVEPLVQGMGITLGNSMRRILIGYLPGVAVTRVRMDGIQHEFSVIPHAREDVIEFLLNIKSLRLKPISGQPGRLILDVEGAGQVTAADIKPSADFDVHNLDQVLVTLNSPEARLYLEMDVEQGVGFQPADTAENLPLGTIPVDAIFSPIRKMNYSIEPTHEGRETSNERLILDIWTDGTISATEAMSNGAAILIEQLSPFVNYSRLSQMKAEERAIRLAIPDEKYNMPVEQLDLSVRTMNCLRRSGVGTVGELIGKGPKELLKLRNFGQKSYKEIEERLETMGLSFTPQGEAEEADEAEEAEVEV